MRARTSLLLGTAVLMVALGAPATPEHLDRLAILDQQIESLQSRNR